MELLFVGARFKLYFAVFGLVCPEKLGFFYLVLLRPKMN